MAEFPRKSLADWEKLAREELKGADSGSLAWQTPEGIAVKPLYTAADLEGLETVGGMPGFAPFVRGPRATMYANRPWTIRQYAGFSTAEEFEQVLQGGSQERADGAVGRLRSRHPSRLRLGPSARRRRCRQGRRRDRLRSRT